jgi:HTH-type transcriptional regulator/antitoxin HigA
MEKMNALSIPAGSRKEYGRLLAQVLPAVIHSQKQYDVCVATMEELLEREHSLTTAERELVSLLALLIENYEQEHFPVPKATPVEMLEFLMDQHRLKQKDLTEVFGSPSVVSEVLSGKRQLSKEHIRRLSERFHLSPEVFF